MLFMVFLYIRSTDSRDCVDNVKGLCETNNIFGWCFHDKVTGVFNCDSSMYCANQEFLRGKMNSTGCFDRASDDIKCCCNEADMCNYNFLNLKMEATIGYQSCIFNYQTSETTIHFKNCIDPWCFAYLKYGDNKNDVILRGCQSRALKRFKNDNLTPTRTSNQVYFDQVNDFPKHPRCDQFADETDRVNDTIKACLDFYSSQNERILIGKLCCCRGSNECNSDILKHPNVKQIKDLKITHERNSEASSNTVFSFPFNCLIMVGILILQNISIQKCASTTLVV